MQLRSESTASDDYVLCIINEKSGSGFGKSALTSSKQEGVKIVSLLETSKTDLISLIKKAKFVVVAGGDGSVSSIAKLISGTSTPLAVVPFGTANDLAKDLKVFKALKDKSLNQAIEFYNELYSNNQIKRVPLWKISGEGFEVDFLNYASIGFDAAVVGEFAKKRGGSKSSILRNRTRYFIESIKQLAKNNKVAISNPNTFSGITIIFANIKSYMGLGILTKEKNLESLAIVEVKSLFDYLRMILFIPRIVSSEIKDAVFNLPLPVALQADGEAYGIINSSNITVKRLESCNFLAI